MIVVIIVVIVVVLNRFVVCPLEQMVKWMQISKGMGGLCLVLGAYNFVAHFTHEHEHGEHIPYSYMKLRTKPFPWAATDCDLFDLECKRKFKAAQQAME